MHYAVRITNKNLWTHRKLYCANFELNIIFKIPSNFLGKKVTMLFSKFCNMQTEQKQWHHSL